MEQPFPKIVSCQPSQQRYDKVVNRLLRTIRIAVLSILTILTLFATSLWFAHFTPEFKWVALNGDLHITGGSARVINRGYCVWWEESEWSRWIFSATAPYFSLEVLLWHRPDQRQHDYNLRLHRYCTIRRTFFPSNAPQPIVPSKLHPELNTVRLYLPRTQWFIVLPPWLVIAIFGTYPTITFIRVIQSWRRRNRNPNGCKTCGYDLTGNESGVCPECGNGVKNMQVRSR